MIDHEAMDVVDPVEVLRDMLHSIEETQLILVTFGDSRVLVAAVVP